MAKTDPFSVRLPCDVYNDLFNVIAATGGEVTKTDIVCRAVRSYLMLLRANPSMIEGYDIDSDMSVTQKKML